jgi:hypothetical protein
MYADDPFAFNSQLLERSRQQYVGAVTASDKL